MWPMPLIQVPRMLRQEDCTVKARLGHLGRFCLQEKKRKKSKGMKFIGRSNKSPLSTDAQHLLSNGAVNINSSNSVGSYCEGLCILSFTCVISFNLPTTQVTHSLYRKVNF